MRKEINMKRYSKILMYVAIILGLIGLAVMAGGMAQISTLLGDSKSLFDASIAIFALASVCAAGSLVSKIVH